MPNPSNLPAKNITPAPNTYRAHRERQRRRIIEAAEKLFDEQGIDRVTMADITSASGVRASTIYQYFSNKDDIVWAILKAVLEDASERARANVEAATSGLSKISAMLEFISDELSKYPAKVRFMAQFDAMYARDWPVERLLTLEAQINPQGFRYFSKLIRQGIADGSLQPDLDPDLTLHAVMNALIGAQRRLASLANKVELEYGQPVDRLFRETIRILLLGLRAADNPLPVTPKTSKTTTRKRSQ